MLAVAKNTSRAWAPGGGGGARVKDFRREDTLFSLCGLNCGLCSMRLGGHCPGCGGGPGNQPCAIARCSREHGGVAYCYACADYPCARYEGEEAYDSFITHRHRRQDLARAQRLGAAAYRAEQEERVALLEELLTGYNDGRRKTLFCLACNLLALPALRGVLAQLRAETDPGGSPKERAARAAALLQGAAAAQGEELKLRRKPGRR